MSAAIFWASHGSLWELKEDGKIVQIGPETKGLPDLEWDEAKQEWNYPKERQK